MSFLSTIRRPVRAIELPGGSAAHVRDLTFSELRTIEAQAAEVPGEEDRAVRTAMLICAYSLCEADGTAVFPAVTEGDLRTLESALTVSQMEAIATAVVKTRSGGGDGTAGVAG